MHNVLSKARLETPAWLTMLVDGRQDVAEKLFYAIVLDHGRPEGSPLSAPGSADEVDAWLARMRVALNVLAPHEVPPTWEQLLVFPERSPIRAALLEQLLMHGVDHKVRGLHALRTHDPAWLSRLLAAGFDPCQIDDFGSTPLHHWARDAVKLTPAFPLLLRMLVDAGADVNARDPGWFTPLSWAATAWSASSPPSAFPCLTDHDVSSIQALLAAGADPNPVHTDGLSLHQHLHHRLRQRLTTWNAVRGQQMAPLSDEDRPLVQRLFETEQHEQILGLLVESEKQALQTAAPSWLAHQPSSSAFRL